MQRGLISAVLILAFAIQSKAQDTRRTSVWTDFTLSYQFNAKLALTGDVGYRFNKDLNLDTYYVRPILAWSPSAIFSYQFGTAMFYQDIPDAADDVEFRLHQTMTIKWPQVIGISFAHRFQIEERFFRDFTLDQTDFVARGRYRLQVSSPDFTLFKIHSKFYGLINAELLLNLNGSDIAVFANQDRFMIGLGNRLSSKWKVEFHYQLLGARLNADEKFTIGEDVFRLRLFYLINELD